MPGRRHTVSPERREARARRSLSRAGCDAKTLEEIVAHVHATRATPEERAAELAGLAGFVAQIGVRAARDYFLSLQETNAIAELTDPAVLQFARSVDPHTAEWYFWALWGTKAVRELTDRRVLEAAEFFRSIDGPATVEYFLAIRETQAAGKLTDPKLFAFAESIGSDAAVEYFGAFWETKAVDVLTGERLLSFAETLKGDAAKEYFLAFRETKAVAELTRDGVLELARALGPRAAGEFFRAIRATKSPVELTSDRVTVFAESIGRACAREYFQVLGSTKKVAALTSDRLLRASGVIRAIGSDAALDYFLAVADTNVVPEAPAVDGGSSLGNSVPVLTLLDLPNYGWFRPTSMAGVSAAFWGALWLGTGVLTGSPAVLGVGAALGAWAALLGAAYLLAGLVSARSAAEFLRERRRLLNEHGIRWHDCLAGDRRCRLCWTASHDHADERFDYGSFCRCPAC